MDLFYGLIWLEVVFPLSVGLNIILWVLKINFFYNNFLWEVSVSLVIEWKLSFSIGTASTILRVKCLVQLFEISIKWVRRWRFLSIKRFTAFMSKMVISALCRLDRLNAIGDETLLILNLLKLFFVPKWSSILKRTVVKL